MITTTIKWHDPAEELPTESGNYLVAKDSGYITELHYTSKHKLFNAQDWYEEDEARRFAIDCKYWAKLPEFSENESEDE